MTALIFALWMSSPPCFLGPPPGAGVGPPGGPGAIAGDGLGRCIGGGPVGCLGIGKPPSACPVGVGVGVIHSLGKVACWIGRALRTASVIDSRSETEKSTLAPGMKLDATGLCPKNERPSSMIAHVIHTQIRATEGVRAYP
jgi:hypothetical protein